MSRDKHQTLSYIATYSYLIPASFKYTHNSVGSTRHIAYIELGKLCAWDGSLSWELELRTLKATYELTFKVTWLLLNTCI